jgi:hypothetical protein
MVMKKLLLLLVTSVLLLSLKAPVSAQTFSNNTVLAIPNTGIDLLIPIPVSGLPAAANSSFGLSGVCFTAMHQYDANLRISLQSPDGNRIVLVDGKGGGGQNFINTCVAENAMGGWIMNAFAPFTGNYFPQQSLNILNNNQDPNGTWYFVLNDVFVPSDTGVFQSVAITFSTSPPPNPMGTGPCSAANAGGCQCPDLATGECDLLPDISASPLSIVQDHHEFPGYIEVGVATPNIGWGPLEIHGIQSCFCDTIPVSCSTTLCPDGQPPKQLVNQRIYHKNGNAMNYYDRPAGTMSYHPSHGHIHVDDWVHNTIRTWSPDPDPRNWPIIGAGTKISFCLVNLFSCDTNFGFCEDSLGNPLHVSDFPNANFGNVSGCTTDQGIYVGYADEYNSGLAGQEIYVSDACNDTYYIVSIIDPLDHFLESKENNNWTAVPITFTQQANGTLEASGFNFSISNNHVDFTANAVTPDSCVWSWGDGTFTTATTSLASHDYTQPGTYVVYLYAYNHCGPRVSADTIQIVPVGLEQTEREIISFDAFPNPSNGKINFTYTLINSSNVSIEIFDAYGNSVRNLQTQKQTPGKYKVLFDPQAENFGKGIYTVKLGTNKENKTIRIIIM